MDIYQFKNLMAKENKYPIFVFFGDEEFFIHEALSAVKANYSRGAIPVWR